MGATGWDWVLVARAGAVTKLLAWPIEVTLPGLLGGSITIGGGGFTVNIATGDGKETAPEWLESFDGGYPGFSSAGLGAGPGFATLGQYPGGQPMKIKRTFEISAKEGDRIRVSMAWDNCPTSNKGTGPSALAADFDLFLVDFDAEEPIAASRSYDNNNEGFDFVIPQEGEVPKPRNLELVVGYDLDGTSPCGSPNESFWMVYAYGPPDSFP